jgi:PIN domain nuclease of toxin-antitoxin system
MTDIVLDASAVMAMALREQGGDRVHSAIVSTKFSISISAVNWSEALAKLRKKSSIMTGEKLATILPGVEVVPFDQDQAEKAAILAKACSALSLGDRACLALASKLNATAWTTDKIWARYPTGAKLEMLR